LKNLKKIIDEGLIQTQEKTFTEPFHIEYKNELLLSNAKAHAELNNWKRAGKILEGVIWNMQDTNIITINFSMNLMF